MVDPTPIPVAADDDALRRIREVVAAGPYRDTWESLATHPVPEWFTQAKFGVFVHWGVYSVPAYGTEWYPRLMYQPGSDIHRHHVETYGDPAVFGYKDFIPQFTMERFDPAAWASVFRRAGAEYVVPVAEHHDGFPLYDEPRTRWKATEMGPKRDVFGDLTAAVRAQWMVPGASSHRAEHWFFLDGGMRFDSDVRDPHYADFYQPAQREEVGPTEAHLEDWLLRTAHIIDAYRPQVLWFDWWIEQPAFEPYRRLLAAYYYNRGAEWGRGVVLQAKYEAFPPGTALLDVERGSVEGIHDLPWQNDTSVSRSSWGWIEGHDWKSVPELVAELIDVVAKNGNLLLNIGPKSDGTIADEERDLLHGLGDWLAVNGEGVYGTRPWRVFGEGPTEVATGPFSDGAPLVLGPSDFRFTTRRKGDTDLVYVLAVDRPTDGTVRVTELGSRATPAEVRSVELLGGSAVPFAVEPDALVLHLPDELPGDHGFGLRVTVSS